MESIPIGLLDRQRVNERTLPHILMYLCSNIPTQDTITTTISYPVSVDPWVGLIPNRLCTDEAHWPRNHNRPMSFVFTYLRIPYLDTLGIHANWIDYSVLTHLAAYRFLLHFILAFYSFMYSWGTLLISIYVNPFHPVAVWWRQLPRHATAGETGFILKWNMLYRVFHMFWIVLSFLCELHSTHSMLQYKQESNCILQHFIF